MKRLDELEYISVAEAKAKLSEKINNAANRGRRFAITSYGRPKAVLIDYREYLALTEKPQGSNFARTISLDTWKKDSKKNSEIIESISSLFDEKKLCRKGQKGYKTNANRKAKK